MFLLGSTSRGFISDCYTPQLENGSVNENHVLGVLLSFKQTSAELTRIGAVFSSLLKLGILPGERALRKAATRLCILLLFLDAGVFSTSCFPHDFFVG